MLKYIKKAIFLLPYLKNFESQFSCIDLIVQENCFYNFPRRQTLYFPVKDNIYINTEPQDLY